MLAWQIESVFEEFPTASIQLHAPEGVLLEGDTIPVKAFEQDWSTWLSLTPYLHVQTLQEPLLLIIIFLGW